MKDICESCMGLSSQKVCSECNGKGMIDIPSYEQLSKLVSELESLCQSMNCCASCAEDSAENCDRHKEEYCRLVLHEEIDND